MGRLHKHQSIQLVLYGGDLFWSCSRNTQRFLSEGLVLCDLSLRCSPIQVWNAIKVCRDFFLPSICQTLGSHWNAPGRQWWFLCLVRSGVQMNPEDAFLGLEHIFREGWRRGRSVLPPRTQVPAQCSLTVPGESAWEVPDQQSWVGWPWDRAALSHLVTRWGTLAVQEAQKSSGLRSCILPWGC